LSIGNDSNGLPQRADLKVKAATWKRINFGAGETDPQMITKTYTALASIPKTKVVTCSAVLENHMQCWRAGDFLVRQITVIPAAPATKTTPAVAEQVDVTDYQLCRRHANADKEEYDKTNPPTPEAAA
jgi:hypothetical protein